MSLDTNDHPPSDRPDRTDRDTLQHDLVCLTCGYNLKSLNRRGDCPECGLPIQHTLTARRGMTKRELAKLAYRVTALWFFLGMLRTLVGSWNYLFRSWNIPITLAVSVTITLFIWFKADWLARITLKQDGPLLITGRLVARQAMSVAMGIIGVLYLLSGISAAVWMGANYLLDFDPDYLKISSVGALLNLVIGLILLFGATRIAKAFLWLRTAGLRNKK